MRRKTNLFYTSGPDSKFLTFSNYTESLTGNFLSTDTKLYPSMFLCLYIPGLNDENNIKDFIKNYLVAYYENKLAVLRDFCIEEDKKPENYLAPLAYLLDTIKKYADDKSLDYNGHIPFLGDITEQDYNGTYTDTICTISFSNIYEGTIKSNTAYKKNDLSINDNNSFVEFYNNQYYDRLYGWEDNELTSEYQELKNGQLWSIEPLHDITSDNVFYKLDPEINLIEVENITKDLEKTNSIKFNIVIPLFDVTNINYHTQHYIKENLEINEGDEESESVKANIRINDNKTTDCYRKNVPLGIWFANEDIELKKDMNTNFSQSWSLMISSQFKPFPYTFKQTNQIVENSSSNAYPTFAMILSRQNEILDMFKSVSKQLYEQNQKIESLQSQINNKASDFNIDKLWAKFIEFEYENNKKYNKLEERVKEYMENLAWKAAE